MEHIHPKKQIGRYCMICEGCGISFKSRYKGRKTILCKKCKWTKQNEYSVIELYYLLQKLFDYEPEIYMYIKMFEIPLFKFKRFIDGIEFPIRRISNYYNIDEITTRYNSKVIQYMIKNDKRLLEDYDYICREFSRVHNFKSILIETIPLFYLPYTTKENSIIPSTSSFKIVEEHFVINYSKAEYDIMLMYLKKNGLSFDITRAEIN